jgi:hypothetical protein
MPVTFRRAFRSLLRAVCCWNSPLLAPYADNPRLVMTLRRTGSGRSRVGVGARLHRVSEPRIPDYESVSRQARMFTASRREERCHVKRGCPVVFVRTHGPQDSKWAHRLQAGRDPQAPRSCWRSRRECHDCQERVCAHRRDYDRQTTAAARVCGVREDRRRLGASQDVPGVRSNVVLRLLAEQARVQTCCRTRPSGNCVSGARRALAVLLSR